MARSRTWKTYSCRSISAVPLHKPDQTLSLTQFPLVSKAEIAAFSDDHMVEELNVHGSRCLGQLLGKLFIRAAGPEAARWMVVKNDDTYSTLFQRPFKHQPGIDR